MTCWKSTIRILYFLVIIMVITVFLTCTAYGIIAPFLPFELKRKQVSEHFNGWIFILYPIAFAISGPLVPSLTQRFNRINVVVTGILLLGLFLIILGLLPFVHNKMVYIMLTFLARFITGGCCGTIDTILYSIAVS